MSFLSDSFFFKTDFRAVLGSQKIEPMDFPGGAVAKNPPANVEDMGLIPSTGRSHMLQSN